MWICVRCIEREIEIIDREDKKEDILATMYLDMCRELDGVDNLVALTEDFEADYCDSDFFGWANYKGGNYDWKCFWI